MSFFESYSPEPHKLRRKQIWEKHSDELKAMMGHNSWSALIVLAIIGVQLSLSIGSTRLPWWGVGVLAYFVGAFFNHALYVFIHEATHNLIFKKSLFNRLIAIACDIPLIFPGAMAFRRFHLMHHMKMGEYMQDADLGSELEAKLVGKNPFMKTLWMFFFGVSQALRPMRMKSESIVKDKWILLNLLVEVLFVLSWYWFFGLSSVLYLLFSTIFCLGLHPLGGRWIAEHYTEDGKQETFSYYGPINKVMFNIGYHQEHHDFMQISWDKLPKLKRVASEFYDSQYSHHSYSAVLWQFISNRKMTPYSRVIRNPKVNSGT